MRILVNYDQKDQNYIPVLQYYLKQRGIQAIATTLPLSIGELIMKARSTQAEAILIAHETTLKNCVESPKATLDLYRGSVLRFSIPAVVCNSLSHTQTVPYGAFLLGKDLDKLKLINKEVREEDKFSFTLLDSAAEMQKAMRVLREAACISYDIETKTVEVETEDGEESLEGGETFITCVSYTAISHSCTLTTYVLPLVDFLEDHWKDNHDYAQALMFMREVNALPIPKVMHNGMYDALHSITYHAEPLYWVLDTMAMAHAEYSELPKTLDFVASITLPDYLQWKTDSEQASKNRDIQQYWGYNGKDTWYTAKILLYYLKNLPPYARKNYALQFPLVYPSLYSAFEGILIDQKKREELRAKAKIEVDKELAKLRTLLADPEFKPSSPKQVQHYIYDIFGAGDPRIGQKKDAKTGRRTRTQRGTDEKNLRAIGDQHPLLLRVTSAILNYRENAKAISTYFDFKQRNSRLLWSLNPFGTDTGRMSCSSSSFWCGTQVQNIPPYAKAMLVADDGYILIEIDNSQSEARCTAYLSKETNLIAALEDKNRDFYTSLGTLFFSIPYEQVTKDFRNKILKKIVHGTNYMMGAATFIENAGTENLIAGASHLNKTIVMNKKGKLEEGEITLKDFATQLLESYHNPFPRVREWYQEIALEIKTTHRLTSPLGYTRFFFGDITKNHNMLRGAVAHAPQNLSVAILNIGLLKVWSLVKKERNNVRFKAQIHDSIFIQIKNEELDRLLPIILHMMDNAVEIHGRSLRIPVDYKIGHSWGDMIEIKPAKK